MILPTSQRIALRWSDGSGGQFSANGHGRELSNVNRSTSDPPLRTIQPILSVGVGHKRQGQSLGVDADGRVIASAVLQPVAASDHALSKGEAADVSEQEPRHGKANGERAVSHDWRNSYDALAGSVAAFALAQTRSAMASNLDAAARNSSAHPLLMLTSCIGPVGANRTVKSTREGSSPALMRASWRSNSASAAGAFSQDEQAKSC
jgi:hypothetical protein